MDIESMLAVSASALNAEKLRMNVIAGNLANINSTRTPEGGPYRRKDVIFSSSPVGTFKAALANAQEQVSGVRVEKIITDPRPFKSIYNPGHPDAGSDGYVLMPNVNLIEEMVNMMSASRAYEANINALQTTKGMLQRALDIGSN